MKYISHNLNSFLSRKQFELMTSVSYFFLNYLDSIYYMSNNFVKIYHEYLELVEILLVVII